MSFLTNIFLTLLLELYKITGSLGWSIIGFTILIRLLLLPLSLPTMKLQKKMKELKPELDILGKKHKEDKKALQMAQIELYKKYNVNPLSGCLPQVAQIFFLIILYQVMDGILKTPEVNGVVINTHFLWLNLAKIDMFYVLPILAGVSQLFLSLMIAPGGEVPDVVPNDSKDKSVIALNKKEEGVADMASMMQKQMIFMMPIMTGFIAISFPSGLGLYWIATTVFSIVQQYFTTGFGGIPHYYYRTLGFLKGYIKQ